MKVQPFDAVMPGGDRPLKVEERTFSLQSLRNFSKLSDLQPFDSASVEWLMLRCGSSWLVALTLLVLVAFLSIPVLLATGADIVGVIVLSVAACNFMSALILLVCCDPTAEWRDCLVMLLALLMQATTLLLVVLLTADDKIARQANFARFQVLFKCMPMLGCQLPTLLGYLLASLLIDVGTHTLIAIILGDPFESSHVSLLVSTTLVIAGMAWGSCNAMLHMCSVEEEMMLKHGGCKAFVDFSCDAVVQISSDARQIISCDERFQKHVGHSAIGRPIDKFVESDQLLSTLAHAKVDVAEKIHGSLIQHKSQYVAVAIIIINKGGPARQMRCSQRCSHAVATEGFLLGIQIVKEPKGQTPTMDRRYENNDTPLLQPRFASVSQGDRQASNIAFRAALEDANVASILCLSQQQHWNIETNELRVDETNVLGAGGFGTVFMGSFQGSPVAVKRPRDIRMSAELLSELQLLRHIRHPNIVLFHGAHIDVDGNSLSLVFELIRGQTLLKFMQSKDRATKPEHVVEGDKLDIISGIALALRYLHSRSIIHGDLSPNNIFVECWQDGLRSKLGDFGLSSRIAVRGVTGKVGGVPRWTAPEVYDYVPCKLCTSRDVFSFGRLASYVITNMIPYHTYVADEVILRLRGGLVEKPLWPDDSALVASCRHWIERCLKLMPEQRPSMVSITAEIAKLKAD